MLIAYWMAPCISVDRKTQNMGFYRNMQNFEMVIAVSKTSHICYKPVSTEYCKVGTCSPKALNVSDS